jgi:hypothetical protein
VAQFNGKPMKTIPILLLLGVAWVPPIAAQEVLRPKVAAQFGKPIVVQAVFVAKFNDYYSQNMVSEPYTLSVTSVNGKTLKTPVLIEYLIEPELGEIRVGKKERPQWERLGASLTFEAYEDVYASGRPVSWWEEDEQGRGFVMVNRLHVRLPKKKG